MYSSLRQSEDSHITFLIYKLPKSKLFTLSQQPPDMKNEDVSMFKLIWDKLRIKAFRYISCPHVTIFSLLEAHAIRKIH